MKKQLTLMAVAPLLVVACAKIQPAPQAAPTKSCINVSGEWTGTRGGTNVHISIAQTACESISVTTVELDPIKSVSEPSRKEVILAQDGKPTISDDENSKTSPVFSENEIRLVTTWSHLDAEQTKDKQSIRVFK